MTDDELAQIVWYYHVLNQKVEKSDCILVLGNSDLRTAEKSAKLFNQGYAGWLIATGGFGRLTRQLWNEPEANKFAEVAMGLGVPKYKILIENQSKNTFENFRYSNELLKEGGLIFNSFIIVTKPYMERRAYAMANKFWGSNKRNIVTSPEVKFKDYPNENISKELTINMIVGELQRIIYYGKRGELERQVIPQDVLLAYKDLLKRGYDKQIIDVSNLPAI